MTQDLDRSATNAVTRTGVLLSNTNQESSSRYGQERKTQAKDGPQRTGRTRSTQDLFLTSKCLAKAQGLTAQALFTTGCHANLEMDLLQGPNFFRLKFRGCNPPKPDFQAYQKSASQCPAYTHHIQTVWILSKEV